MLAPAVLLLISLLAQPGRAGSGNEAVSWRVWSAADGMNESYISQVSRAPSGQILVRHGDVSALNVLDGLKLTDMPDVPSLGSMNADAAGNLYTFDKAGVLVFAGGKWSRRPIPGLAAFGQFGNFEHFRWFEYTFNTDMRWHVSGIPGSGGKMLFSSEDRIVEEIGTHGETRVLRESAKSSIGAFIQVSPADEGAYFVSGETGLAILRPSMSGWSELPKPPQGFTRFVFPARTLSHGVITTANGPGGHKYLLSFNDAKWSVIYAGGSSLRGWETLPGQLWAMDTNKLISLSRGQAHPVDLRSVVTGSLNDVAPDGDAFWLATTQGLARYAPPLWQLPEGAPDTGETVNSIAQDKQGTLWFTSGALLIAKVGEKWRTYTLPHGEKQDSARTGALCPMDDGRLLLATNNANGLLEMDTATGHFRSITHPEGRRIGWVDRRDGKSIWVVTLQAGGETSRLEIFDGTSFIAVPGAEAIPLTDVRAVLGSKNGVIWVGGTGNFVRIVKGRLEPLRKEEGLMERAVFSLLEGPDGTLYIGHRAAISAYDGTRFRVLTKGMDRTRRLAISPDGTLWAASGTGIHRYHGGSWLANTSDDGLASSAAYTVFADAQGKIWAGTTLGLRRYAPESDRDAPVTSMQEDQNLRRTPPGGDVRFAFSGVDRWKQTIQARLLFSWKLDDGEWSSFDKATLVSIHSLASGNHRFQARAMDRNGNIDPAPPVFEFQVLLPWYRESGFYAVAGFLALAIGLLLKTGFIYHRNLRFQSRHDSLTGLPNRLQFEEALANAIERAGPTSGLAVFFIDLDGFKTVNDTHGHLAGDKLLNDVGALLRTCVRKGDLLARIGGDEFAILNTTSGNREAVSSFAARVLGAIRSAPVPGSSRISASIGISLAPEHGTSSSVLVRLADLAMYQSKSRSGDCWQFYEPGMKATFRGTEMVELIRCALKDESFVLFYQPIVDAACRVVRMECLVRMNDPALGLISPGSFIGVAEESGLIHELGSWVLREGAGTAAAWRRSGCNMPVAINISPVQLVRIELADEILGLLREFALPASALTIEITEGALARDQATATAVLTKLKDAGVSIALDDFGTGYSSLSMIDSLPLDEIKLDRSFAASIFSERTRDVIFQTVSLARKLKSTTVMEGIEEVAQFEASLDLGCDLFQGFLIAPPLELEKATRFINAHSLQPVAELELAVTHS